jgi:hypothetical protein
MLNTGYEEPVTKNKISHLLFTEDLRLIDKRAEDCKKKLQTVKTFSFYIHVELWLENVKIFYSKEKLILSQNLKIYMNNNTTG